MKEENMLEVIYIQAGEPPKSVRIENELEPMQELVGGHIEEYMPFEDDIAIICNEEGKILGLEPNRAIYDENGDMIEVICGDFFLCYAPIDSEEFKDFPENLKKKYEEKFKMPERFFMTPSGIRVVKTGKTERDEIQQGR